MKNIEFDEFQKVVKLLRREAKVQIDAQYVFDITPLIEYILTNC